MRVLDLYSGLEGWSAEFKKRGHEVVTVDSDFNFHPTLVADVGSLSAAQLFNKFGWFHVVLASPPCNCYSVLSIKLHWRKGEPTKETRKSIALVRHTLQLIYGMDPRYWVMENPRGMLRRAIGPPAATVTYCQYGATYMKPTDLWGNLPPSFIPRKCRNLDPCHQRTPRGFSNTLGVRGYSGRDAAISSKIPPGLSLAMCLAAETDLERSIHGQVLGDW